MRTRAAFGLAIVAGIIGGCDGESSDPVGSDDAGVDAAIAHDDAGADGGACPAGGTGSLRVEVAIESGVPADVSVLAADGTVVGDTITATTTRSLPSGLYGVSAGRVRKAGELVGPAYQPSVEAMVCVRDGEESSLEVSYTREPGSTRLWLTQSNGDGTQVMGFDAEQLSGAGEQAASVGLEPGLTTAGPIRVDGLGRLWVGSSGGKLVAFDTERLGSSSSEPPDIVLEGAAICGASLPCGPRAIAFDARGALWVALLDRIVQLAPDSLNSSGEPSAAVTITSPDLTTPGALAFDLEGDLWVGDASGALLEFAAARLSADIADGPADTVIFTQQPGPVMIGLGGPEGLVFDPDGNLWVGYFAGNDLVRLTPAELATSAPESAPLIPTVHFKIGVEALVTDLALDEAGNLWLPGGAGSLYRIDADQLSAETPALIALTSSEIGSVEKLTLSSVPGPLFITEPRVVSQ